MQNALFDKNFKIKTKVIKQLLQRVKSLKIIFENSKTNTEFIPLNSVGDKYLKYILLLLLQPLVKNTC